MTKQHRAASVSAVLVLLFCPGCSEASETATDATSDRESATELVSEYIAAVVSADPVNGMRLLTVYPDTEHAEFIAGEDLPAECLETEKSALISEGVTADSSADIITIGGSEVPVEGTNDTVSYEMIVGQLGVPGGGSVGRGVIFQPGGPRIQMQPSTECDQLLGL